MVIKTNTAALNAQRRLGINNSAASKNLEKLSSGYRVNRAGDDAAGLAISEKMRGQIRGLGMAENNCHNGVSLVQTAEGGMNEIHAILNRMRELSVQAVNGTYNDQTDRENIDLEIQALKGEINRIAQYTNYNGKGLLNGHLKDGEIHTAHGVSQMWNANRANMDPAALLGNAGISDFDYNKNPAQYPFYLMPKDGTAQEITFSKDCNNNFFAQFENGGNTYYGTFMGAGTVIMKTPPTGVTTNELELTIDGTIAARLASVLPGTSSDSIVIKVDSTAFKNTRIGMHATDPTDFNRTGTVLPTTALGLNNVTGSRDSIGLPANYSLISSTSQLASYLNITGITNAGTGDLWNANSNASIQVQNVAGVLQYTTTVKDSANNNMALTGTMAGNTLEFRDGSNTIQLSLDVTDGGAKLNDFLGTNGDKYTFGISYNDTTAGIDAAAGTVTKATQNAGAGGVGGVNIAPVTLPDNVVLLSGTPANIKFENVGGTIQASFNVGGTDGIYTGTVTADTFTLTKAGQSIAVSLGVGDYANLQTGIKFHGDVYQTANMAKTLAANSKFDAIQTTNVTFSNAGGVITASTTVMVNGMAQAISGTMSSGNSIDMTGGGAHMQLTVARNTMAAYLLENGDTYSYQINIDINRSHSAVAASATTNRATNPTGQVISNTLSPIKGLTFTCSDRVLAAADATQEIKMERTAAGYVISMQVGGKNFSTTIGALNNSVVLRTGTASDGTITISGVSDTYVLDSRLKFVGDILKTDTSIRKHEMPTMVQTPATNAIGYKFVDSGTGNGSNTAFNDIGISEMIFHKGGMPSLDPDSELIIEIVRKSASEFEINATFGCLPAVTGIKLTHSQIMNRESIFLDFGIGNEIYLPIDDVNMFDYDYAKVSGAIFKKGPMLFDMTNAVIERDGKALALQIGANGNADQTIKFEVDNMCSERLGETIVGGTSIFLSDINVKTAADADFALVVIDNAVNQVSQNRAILGAIQNRLEHTINNLGVTKENLTAAESTIRDADMANLMIEFTKNNILLQSTQAMLAQAGQLPQGVLKLLS